MEEKDIYLTFLYDYYKDLFTDKQKGYFEDYYYDNLTMEEIAENNGVSRNAISKSLIEVKDKLNYYEEILGLYKKGKQIKEILGEKEFNKIEDLV